MLIVMLMLIVQLKMNMNNCMKQIVAMKNSVIGATKECSNHCNCCRQSKLIKMQEQIETEKEE